MQHIISKTNIRLQNRKYILIVNCSDNSNFFSNNILTENWTETGVIYQKHYY